MKNGKTILFYFLLFLGYAGLSGLFTWPLVKNFLSAIIGQTDFTDGPFFLWNLWWVNRAISSGQNPLFSNFVFYPAEVNLTLHTLTFTSAIIARPLLKIFSAITAQNIILLFSIALSALGTAALVDYLTKNKLSGIISGIIFAFTPNVAAHLQAGHYNLAALWAVPLIVLFFLKTLREESPLNPLIFSLLMIAQFYLDLQTSSAALIILFFILIWSIIFNFRITVNLKKMWLLCLAIVPLIVFFFIPYVYWMKQFWMDKTLDRTFNNGDLNLIFGNNPLNPILGGNYSLLTKLIGSYRENTISLGFSAMALAVLSFAFTKNIKDKIMFFILAIIGIVLAAGPNLQINGQIFQNIRLPFFYIARLPFFDIGVVPTRYIIVSSLALAVLAGYFCAGIFGFLKFYGTIALKAALVLIFSAAVALEYYSGPLKIDHIRVSPIYSKIANEPGNFTVLASSANAHDQYFQTVHLKKMVSGSLSRRIQPFYTREYQEMPGVGPLVSEKLESEYFAPEDSNRELVLKSFRELKIKYIFVDKTTHTEEVVQRARKYLSDIIGLPVYAEDSLVIVYKID